MSLWGCDGLEFVVFSFSFSHFLALFFLRFSCCLLLCLSLHISLSSFTFHTLYVFKRFMHTHFLGLLVKSILFIFFTLFIWYLYLRIRALVPYILHVMGFNRIYIHIGRSYYIVNTSFLYSLFRKRGCRPAIIE